MKVGIISDTHGLLRPEAATAFRGVDHIIHAGDIGDRQVIAGLAAIAPVTAIRGNVDTDDWASAYPAEASVTLAGRAFFILHDRKALGVDPAAEGFAAVISGHSHKPGSEIVDGVLYVNPGSAGPRRFKLPVTVAIVDIATAGMTPAIIPLLEPGVKI